MVDAVIVGSGPNGLSAAITLASEGLSVLVLEAKETIGGGSRTAELTLPGFHHDVCSAIHPMGVLSPFFKSLALERDGVEWIHSEVPLAHPFDDGSVALLHRSVERTAMELGPDGRCWTRLLKPLTRNAEALIESALSPLRSVRHPILMARLGLRALRSCASLNRRFQSEHARALLGGCAAHAMVPLDRTGSAAIGVMLAFAGHVVGWPCARAGSGAITKALARRLRALGGEIRTGVEVRSMADLPSSRVVAFDLTPRQIAAIASDQLPNGFRRRLERYRYGPGIFKIDWALDGPIPWRNPDCARAATVHVGGTFEEIARGENDTWTGRHSERPFVLVAQQSLFDASRAPAGKHTGWAYCHVPHGSTRDMTDAIESNIERFAPGFRDRILARHTAAAAELSRYNPNLIGGDISGGANTLGQLLFRPVARWDPYATPNPKLWICSSSTPPGAGVHGMCGFHAARSILRRSFDRSPSNERRD